MWRKNTSLSKALSKTHLKCEFIVWYKIINKMPNISVSGIPNFHLFSGPTPGFIQSLWSCESRH